MYCPQDITTEQKKVVQELKNRTINDLTPYLLEDESLFYRFCKAREFNLENAETMLRKHIVWRQEMNMDSILTDFKAPEVVVKYHPNSVVGFDKEGCLVRYFDFGNTDFIGLFKSAKKTDHFKYSLQSMEEDVELLKQHSKKLGRTVTQGTYIYNFENLTFGNATHRKTLETALMFMKAFQDNYPERIKFIYHINTTFYYGLMMSVVKTVVASPLLQKVKFYGSDGWKEDLLNQIDADVLPAFLGGNRTDPDGNPMCNTFIIHGQKVPESYYPCNSEKRLFRSPDAKKVNVTRLAKEEISFEAREAGSYLEWEFETKSRDIGFAVYFRETSSEGSKYVELIPKQRIDPCYEPEKGLFKCEKAGTYKIVFDNSYCWLHPKEIYYRARIRNSNDDGT